MSDIRTVLLFASLALNSASSSVIPVGVTVGLTPYSHPVSTLYHAQDNYGQYVYGYSTPTSSKAESKTADGVTTGGYSYIDSNGILQTVNYVADAVNGFRVAATNLPRDLPDVAVAKAQHLAQFEAIKADHAHQRTVQYSNPVAVPIHEVPYVNVVDLPQPVQDLPEVERARAEHLAIVQAAYTNAQSASQILPQPVHDLPEVVRARAEHLAAVEATKARDAAATYLSNIPVSYTTNEISSVPASVPAVVQAVPAVHSYVTPLYSPSSQYHAQDNYGQYSYGYVAPLSSKAETKTADGVTRGGYSYIDANGILQTVNYISDPVNGFRVAATNLPVQPKATLVGPAAPSVEAKAAVAHGVVAQNVVPQYYTQEVYY